MPYTKLIWEDYPSTQTPVDADNLNRMEDGIADANQGVAENAAAIQDIIDAGENKVLILPNVPITAILQGDIATYYDSRIRADHYVARVVWADPSAIVSDVTITTYAGRMVMNGSCSAATSAWVMLTVGVT